MAIGPCMTQNEAFWRTSAELRQLLASLRAELGRNPNLRASLGEVEALHGALEQRVRSCENPLQRVVGFP